MPKLFEDYIRVGGRVYVDLVYIPTTNASCDAEWIRMEVLDPHTIGTVAEVFFLMVEVKYFPSEALVAC